MSDNSMLDNAMFDNSIFEKQRFLHYCVYERVKQSRKSVVKMEILKPNPCYEWHHTCGYAGQKKSSVHSQILVLEKFNPQCGIRTHTVMKEMKK